jgi:hypothetical protein
MQCWSVLDDVDMWKHLKTSFYACVHGYCWTIRSGTRGPRIHYVTEVVLYLVKIMADHAWTNLHDKNVYFKVFTLFHGSF